MFWDKWKLAQSFILHPCLADDRTSRQYSTVSVRSEQQVSMPRRRPIESNLPLRRSARIGNKRSSTDEIIEESVDTSQNDAEAVEPEAQSEKVPEEVESGTEEDDDPNLINIKERTKKGIMIFSSNHIDFYVKRIRFSRQKFITMQDHLYLVKADSHRTRRKPKLINVMEVLKRAVAAIIINLQEYFEPHHHHQLYLTFEDKKFTRGGLNTGNFSLFPLDATLKNEIEDKRQAEFIASESLDLLAQLLRSNAFIELKKSFHIFITVLSLEHMKHKWSLGTLKHPRTFAGSLFHRNRIVQSRFVGWNNRGLILLPSIPTLENQCLIVSVIMGYYYRMHLKFKYDKSKPHLSKEYLSLSHVCNPKDSGYSGALSKLECLVADIKYELFRDEDLPVIEGFCDVEKVVPALAEHFKVQIFIFNNSSNKCRYMYPDYFAPHLPPIFLYEERVNSAAVGFFNSPQLYHITPIRKINLFFNKLGYSCLNCGKICKDFRRKHTCKGGPFKSCFVCKRWIYKVHPFTLEPFIDKETKSWYCVRNVEEAVELKCDSCLLTSYTQDCHNNHICHRGKKCDKCSKFVSIRKGVPYSQLLLEHRCNELTCSMCHKLYVKGDEHVCRLRNLQAQPYFTNLAFYDFESTQRLSSLNCFQCHEKEKAYLKRCGGSVQQMRVKSNLSLIRCPDHIDDLNGKSYHVANFCTVLYEDEKRGHFSLITFADPRMNHKEDCMIRKHYLVIPDYLGDGYKPMTRGKKSVKKNSLSSKNNFADDFYDSDVEEVGDYDLYQSYNPQMSSLISPSTDTNNDVDLLRLKNYEVLDKFWIFFAREKFRNFSFLAHNASGYDSILLLQAAAENSITPEVVPRGNKILSMSLPTLNIYFLDSMLYCPGSLSKLAKRYHLTCGKGFFPHNFNNVEHYNYRGSAPDSSWFIGEIDSHDEKKTKLDYLDNLKKSCYYWNFKDEIFQYCRHDTEILCRSMCKFVREWMDIQSLLKRSSFKPNDDTSSNGGYLHPFSPPFITFSGFIYGIYQYFDGYQHDLRVMKDEKGLTSIKTSEMELQFVMWQYDKLGKPFDFYSAFTSPKPHKLGNCIPDFYSPSIDTAGFFHGCLVHGHLDKSCTIVPPNSNEMTKNYFKQTFGSLQTRFNAQLESLRVNFGVRNIIVMWECQWKEMLQSGKIAIPKLLRPRERLIPRVALRGGRVDTFAFFWSQTMNPDQSLYYVDFNSLYPTVSSSLEYPFPVGTPKIIINPNQLSRISCSEGKCFDYNSVEIHGLGHVSILAPNNMNIPFLPYRVDKKSVCALCCTCAINMSNNPCNHNEREKAFTSVYTLQEVAYACSIGYRVLKWYEIYAYYEAKPIFRRFLQLLSSYKVC